MRHFEGGATRDDDRDKLDYEGANSPLVEKRYTEYLRKHCVQADGTIRGLDNWQNLFKPNHFDVCIKSSCRHHMDLRLHHDGFPEEAVEKDLEDVICANIFNLKAYLFGLILKRKQNDNCINKLNEELRKMIER